MSAAWTEAHRREVALALLDEARTLLLDGDTERARDAANEATAVIADTRPHAGTTAENCRRALRGLGLNARRIEYRVRGLATGRLIRETAWRAESDEGEEKTYRLREQAIGWLGRAKGRILRVTRIRGAP